MIAWVVGVAAIGLSSDLRAEDDVPWVTETSRLISIGRFFDALEYSQSQITSASSGTSRCDGYLLQATAYTRIGNYEQAYDSLELARQASIASGSTAGHILSLIQLSDFFAAYGDRAQARELAETALQMANTFAEMRLRLRALHNWANVANVLGEPAQALKAYQEALDLVTDTNDVTLQVTMMLNAARTHNQLGQRSEACKIAFGTETHISAMPDTYEKATLLLTLGEIVQRLQFTHAVTCDKGATADLSYRAFAAAQKIGTSLDNSRLRSLSNGYLARVYEDQGLTADALSLTNRAIFFANRVDAPDISYKWYWQQGRLLARLNRVAEAVSAYETAIDILLPVRNRLGAGIRNAGRLFEEEVKPVFYELADLYIGLADSASDTERQRLLHLSLDTLEMFKSAELENYFHDECVAALQSRATRIEEFSSNAGILYPMILPDRLVLLLLIGDEIFKFETAEKSAVVQDTVRSLRKGLQQRTTHRYLHAARTLHDWLIRPIEPTLEAAAVDTLTIVPDGTMHLIPFSTLHDGEQFLIEKLALATTPGLTLTDPERFDHENMRMMVAGLSKAVLGHPPLPNVPTELQAIHDMFGGQLLLDEEYTADSVRNALRSTSFEIVHLATHGEFGGDTEDTYLLTFDEKMTMNKLESLIKLARFRDDPIELLTLSACKTGVGDEKSALGLAGIAVKSGARSSLATLWYVNDEATMRVITEFYRQLAQNPRYSKAQALRQSQLTVLKERRFRHPAYWAPFLMIGNWL